MPDLRGFGKPPVADASPIRGVHGARETAVWRRDRGRRRLGEPFQPGLSRRERRPSEPLSCRSSFPKGQGLGRRRFSEAIFIKTGHSEYEPKVKVGVLK